jgi:predicted membrane protein
MQGDERARLGVSGGVTQRAKSFLAKTAAIVTGGVLLASAFLISLAFFVVALAVVLVVGGYLWWKTRELRRQIREQMRGQNITRPAQNTPSGDVIEGVVISKSEERGPDRR